MRKLLLFLVIPMMVLGMMLVAATAHGRVTQEFRPFVGAFVPTGAQRNVLEDAGLMGAQMAFEVNDRLHLVGTFAYSTPRPHRRTLGNDVHLYHYDVGAELFRSMPIAGDWLFRPFAGGGVGARTHDFFDRSDTRAQTVFAGYATVGTEFQSGAAALRLEVRDYVTRFKGILGNERAAARNEVVFVAGVAFHM